MKSLLLSLILILMVACGGGAEDTQLEEKQTSDLSGNTTTDAQNAMSGSSSAKFIINGVSQSMANMEYKLVVMDSTETNVVKIQTINILNSSENSTISMPAGSYVFTLKVMENNILKYSDKVNGTLEAAKIATITFNLRAVSDTDGTDTTGGTDTTTGTDTVTIKVTLPSINKFFMKKVHADISLDYNFVEASDADIDAELKFDATNELCALTQTKFEKIVADSKAGTVEVNELFTDYPKCFKPFKAIDSFDMTITDDYSYAKGTTKKMTSNTRYAITFSVYDNNGELSMVGIEYVNYKGEKEIAIDSDTLIAISSGIDIIINDDCEEEDNDCDNDYPTLPSEYTWIAKDSGRLQCYTSDVTTMKEGADEAASLGLEPYRMATGTLKNRDFGTKCTDSAGHFIFVKIPAKNAAKVTTSSGWTIVKVQEMVFDPINLQK